MALTMAVEAVSCSVHDLAEHRQAVLQLALLGEVVPVRHESPAQGSELLCGVPSRVLALDQVHVAEGEGGEVVDDGRPLGRLYELSVDPQLLDLHPRDGADGFPQFRAERTEHVPVVGGGVPQRLRREEQALYRLLVLHRLPLEDVVLVERDDAPDGRELEVDPDRHVPGVPVLLDEPAGVGGPAQSGEAPLGVVGVHVVE